MGRFHEGLLEILLLEERREWASTTGVPRGSQEPLEQIADRSIGVTGVVAFSCIGGVLAPLY